MPLLQKGQVRTAVRQAIDDPNSKRWSDANLDILITLVEDTMFQAIIDSFDYFTSQTDATLTPSGTGTVDITGLTKRFYRIQLVSRNSDGVQLQPKLMIESVPQPAYDLRGTLLTTTPAVTGASSLSVTYAYLPLRFTDLASDVTPLTSEYPEGHESALIYTSASWAMTKGDAENMAQIGRLADVSVDALLTHISRRYPIAPNMRVQAIKQAIIRNPLVAPVPMPPNA